MPHVKIELEQIAQNSYSVNLGGAVELVCIVSADPPVSSITWTRTINGVTATLNIGSLARFTGGTVSNPSLTILNAQASDEGTYVCSAQSSAGTGQSGSENFINLLKTDKGFISSTFYFQF